MDKSAEQLHREYEAAQKAGDQRQASSLWRAFVAKQSEEMAQRDIRRARS